MSALGLARRAAGRAWSLADRACTALDFRERDGQLRRRPAYDERVVLRELTWLPRDGPLVVYDVGAGRGVFAAAAALLPNVKQVYAFEPLPDSARRLDERTQGLPVTCYRLALGDEAGSASLHTGLEPETSSLLPVVSETTEAFPGATQVGSVTVAVATLDDVVERDNLRAADVIKIDVQGYEDRVVRGAERTIRRARFCVLELSFEPLYEGALLFDDVYELMRGLGFRLVGFGGRLRRPDGAVLQTDGFFQQVR